jgi:glycosyltransferase involved in cell wall biosynthesis
MPDQPQGNQATMAAVTVVIPAYNEEDSLGNVVQQLRSVLQDAGFEHEILVVVDGATDGTESVARRVADQVVLHPKNMGYGRSLKSGILAARHDRIAITDADGTYPIDRLPELIQRSDRFDMVVGARGGRFYLGGFVKRTGRIVFRGLSEFATGQRIPDINSGFRVFRRSQILPFFPSINSGFSFTTTSTLVYLLNDLFVDYVPVDYFRREGRSKVHHLRDSVRALQIIIEAILRYNPIKAFLMLAAPLLLLQFLFLLLALSYRTSSMWLLWTMAVCTLAILMGQGFLAIASSEHRRRPSSHSADAKGHGPLDSSIAHLE